MSFTGPLMNIPAEAFSRVCSNLALIPIALVLIEKGQARARYATRPRSNFG